MTAPRQASSGALWIEPASSALGATAGVGRFVADPTYPGDLTIADNGTEIAELRAVGPNGDYLLLGFDRATLIDDVAHPGDLVLDLAGGAPDALLAADLVLSTDLSRPRAAELASVIGSSDLALLRATAARAVLLHVGADYIVH